MCKFGPGGLFWGKAERTEGSQVQNEVETKEWLVALPSFPLWRLLTRDVDGRRVIGIP